MVNFGYNIAQTRVINLDNSNLHNLKQIEERVPSFKRCLNCGACTATCTAQQFTHFNIRKIKSLYQQGEYHNISKELEKCMLCGKCILVCPRGLNLRSIVLNMRKILQK